MVIGIDIDDTITETTESANSMLKLEKKYSYVKDFHDLSRDDYDRFIKKNIIQIQRQCKVKKGAIDVIKWLKEKGCKIIIITARGSVVSQYSKELVHKIEDNTIKYFDKHNIPVDKIIFRTGIKGDACLNEGVDIFIDDKERVLDDIAKKGVRVIKFNSKHESSKHQSVESWDELKNVLEGVIENG